MVPSRSAPDAGRGSFLLGPSLALAAAFAALLLLPFGRDAHGAAIAVGFGRAAAWTIVAILAAGRIAMLLSIRSVRTAEAEVESHLALGHLIVWTAAVLAAVTSVAVGREDVALESWVASQASSGPAGWFIVARPASALVFALATLWNPAQECVRRASRSGLRTGRGLACLRAAAHCDRLAVAGLFTALFLGGWDSGLSVSAGPIVTVLGTVCFSGKMLIFCILLERIRSLVPIPSPVRARELSWRLLVPLAVLELACVSLFAAIADASKATPIAGP